MDVTFVYDQGTNGLNQLTSFADSYSNTTLTYDTFGNLTGKTQISNNINGNNKSQSLNYSYDSNNRLQTITYPSGVQITYQYNNLNQITQVSSLINGQSTTLADAIGYLPMGPMNAMTLGNGLNYQTTYDNGYRLNNYQYGSTLSGGYSYDNNHNITNISRETASNDAAYLYDNLDRISQETDEQIDYSYDQLGNRTRSTTAAQSPVIYNYAANSNRLTQIDNTQRTYDDKGNTLSIGAQTFTYNQAQRMASSSENGTITAQYFYNGIGQRILKTTLNNVTPTYHLYLYNANGQLLIESIYDNNGVQTQSKDTIWLNNKPIAQIRTTGGTSSIYYILTDHLNTPRKVTNNSGTVLWSWNSDAFGTTLANQDVDNNGTDLEFNLRFPGQYFDKESGQHYNYFRDYEPGTGRYLESDPIGLRGGVNTFGYVFGNSINSFDPFGQEVIGRWIQKGWPQVYDFNIVWGDARRPDGWWKFWNNWGTYRALEQRVDVLVGFDWEVECTDTDDCDKRKWNIAGGVHKWLTVHVPLFIPMHPRLGKYTTVLNPSYNLLIKPATSESLKIAGGWARFFYNNTTATSICKRLSN
ncbi:hypothetical protein MNBD_GAMMA01-2006 [hydrothermal vent metagenome]|uniref:Teneurin-like YD-shell domain-containing protein n=1 Tax=hydrothermal vent metagenome TaxID=652676 RepID=A0A3B0V8D4_9ZZZZ